MTTWWAGFAVRDITPEQPLELSGFATREQPATGTHDPLSVRALAFGDGTGAAAIAAVDLLGVDAALTARVRERVRAAVGDALPYVAVIATHTHGGPAVLARALLGTVDDAYLDELVVRVADAVVAAYADRAPVLVRFGLAQERTVAKNRRDAAGPIDADLPVIRFDDPDTGHPRGVLCSYACHPVTLGPGNRAYTRDYPGFLVDRLSEAIGGAPAVFLTGCCAQLNTGHSAMDSILGRGLEKRTFAEAARIGGVLAGLAASTAHRIGPPGGVPDASPANGAWARSVRVQLPITPAGQPDAAAIAALERQVAALASEPTKRGEAAMAEAHLRWARTRAASETTNVETEVAVVALGEIAIVLLPGEIFVEFALELKRRFPTLRLVSVSYANDAIGYLPHRSAFATGGYEVDLAYRHYGYPGPFAEEAGEVLVAAAAGLLTQLAESRRPTSG